MTPQLRERLLATDTAAMIANAQQLQVSGGFADVVGKIAVPTLLYAGSADPLHNAARQTASEIFGAQFVSFPGLNHPAALCRSDLVLPVVEAFLAKAAAH